MRGSSSSAGAGRTSRGAEQSVDEPVSARAEAHEPVVSVVLLGREHHAAWRVGNSSSTGAVERPRSVSDAHLQRLRVSV